MTEVLEFLKYALPIAIQTNIGVACLSKLGASVSVLVKAVEEMAKKLDAMATHDFRIVSCERRIERLEQKEG